MTNKNENIEYVLTLSPEQAKMVETACEFYARMRMGQWCRLVDFMSMDRDDFCDRRDEAEHLLLEARHKVYTGLEPNIGVSYGVGKFEDADFAWEIYEVLRNKIAWHEHPEGGWGVCFDPPMSWTGKPLAKCKVKVKDEDREIEQLDLSLRAWSCLRNHGIKTIAQLAKLSEDDLKRVRNLSQTAIAEIIEKMEKEGYSYDSRRDVQESGVHKDF